MGIVLKNGGDTMFNTVIFDVDGTLLDTERAQLKALKQVLAQHDMNYSLDDLRIIFGVPGKEALQRLNVKNVDYVLAEWEKAIDAYMDEVQLFYAIEEVLQALRAQGKKLGIVTSKTHEQLQHEFEPFGLNHYFDAIVTADDTERPKPDPVPLLLCIEKLNASKEHVLYIGDSIYDYMCARDAEVPFAHALWGAHTTEGITAHYELQEALDILKTV